jgi:hypothetical protein
MEAMEVSMEVVAITWQEAFFVVGTLYTGLLLVVTVVGLIAAIRVKRKVSRKLKELKDVPVRSREYARTFLHTLFNK